LIQGHPLAMTKTKTVLLRIGVFFICNAFNIGILVKILNETLVNAQFSIFY